MAIDSKHAGSAEPAHRPLAAQRPPRRACRRGRAATSSAELRMVVVAEPGHAGLPAVRADVPEVEVVRATAETSGDECRRHRALRDRLHRRSSHHQRELESHGPPGLDRRGKRRQGEGRARCWFAWKIRSSARIMSRLKARSKMRALIWKNCNMDRVRKKFSRRSTIWMKPARRW